MKRLALSLIAALAVCTAAYAAKVNPTSNVLGDTEGAAGTLVLRDSNGEVAADAILANESILTEHIKTNSVLTRHTYLNELTTGRFLCVKTSKMIGHCASAPVAGQTTCDCQ